MCHTPRRNFVDSTFYTAMSIYRLSQQEPAVAVPSDGMKQQGAYPCSYVMFDYNLRLMFAAEQNDYSLNICSFPRSVAAFHILCAAPTLHLGKLHEEV